MSPRPKRGSKKEFKTSVTGARVNAPMWWLHTLVTRMLLRVWVKTWAVMVSLAWALTLASRVLNRSDAIKQVTKLALILSSWLK